MKKITKIITSHNYTRDLILHFQANQPLVLKLKSVSDLIISECTCAANYTVAEPEI